MQTIKNKALTFLMTLILISSIAVSIIAIPNAEAATTKKTYAYVAATPNPVGVGQQTVVRFGITDQLATTNYGWTGLTAKITFPDGRVETLGPATTDSTGGTYRLFTPTVAGNYTLQSHFPEQLNPAAISTIAANATMLASDSETQILVVQQEPIPSYQIPALPQEYWSRPINSQLQQFSAIAGNWLTATNTAATNNRIAVGNDNAPQSAHILWSKPLTSGGLVGGVLNPASSTVGVSRQEIGDAYEGKFLGSIIMEGKLYFDKYSSTDRFHEIACVDLHTGQQLWSKTLLNNLTISRGQLFSWNSIDLLGVYDYLWATANSATLPLLGLSSTAGTTWCAFDPFTGDFVYALYGIPSGSIVFGPNGELLIYTINQANGWMTMWNSSNIPALYNSREVASMGWGQWQPMGKVVNATGLDGVTLNNQPYRNFATPFGINGYQWNVTIPKGLPGSIISVVDDRIVGGVFNTTQVNLWAVSREPKQEGQLLYKTTWNAPADWSAGNVTIVWQATSNEGKDGVLILGEKETRQNYGFSIETGQYLWVNEPRSYLDAYTVGLAGTSSRSINHIYDGRFYAGSYAGILYCYEATTGKLLWTYTATNPNAAGANWGDWPIYPAFIAGGMVYFLHTEHSGYQQALPPGAPFMCVNATTGELVWRADGLFRGTHWGGYPLIGDSIIAAMNTYDQQVYAIGKGPSAITVEAPTTGANVGESLVIRGTVMDVSPGTQQNALKLRFPNGVPAVSDASMSEWMGYVYEQFQIPTNVQGVQVDISVIDANGNFRQVGTATGDISGFYSLAWKPDVPGKYTVIATFTGSKSYYGSYAETAFVADEAPSTAPQSTSIPASMVETYFLPSVAAIIVAIAIVGAIIVLLMLRKRP